MEEEQVIKADGKQRCVILTINSLLPSRILGRVRSLNTGRYSGIKQKIIKTSNHKIYFSLLAYCMCHGLIMNQFQVLNCRSRVNYLSNYYFTLL